MMKKRFTLELQKHPLKNVSVTPRETLNIPNWELALSYQNVYENSKMLIYHQLLNGVLLQKCYQKHNKILVKYVSENFYTIKLLNDPNLLNKKSNLVNPFYVTNLFQHPLKTLENLWFSDVFRGYWKRSVVWDGLILVVIKVDCD